MSKNVIIDKIGNIIDFNPTESLPVGSFAKKIAMEKLNVGQRKVNGYEYGVFSSGAKFKNGDTLLAKITPCLENGKTAQVDILEDNEVAFGSTEFIVLRETNKIDKDYLFYLARSPYFRQLAISCMEGTSGRKRVSESSLQLREITIHKDKKEQQKIAKILFDIDKKIEVNSKIIKELEQMAKELYDYWFVQFDFPDANGKPYRTSGGKMTYNPILKREIPEGWEVFDFEYFVDIFTGKKDVNQASKDSGKYNFFSCAPDPYFSDTYIYDGEAILISGNGSYTGRTSIYKGKFDLYQRTYACTIKDGAPAIMPFLYSRMKYQFEPYIMGGTHGSSIPYIVRDDIAKYKIMYDKYNVNKYSVFASEMLSNIHIINKQNKELAELRDWLLPMLMNGQVTVGESAHKSNTYKQTPIINLASRQDQRFDLWVKSQGLAARGDIDKTTLREIFDAMDDDDK